MSLISRLANGVLLASALLLSTTSSLADPIADQPLPLGPVSLTEGGQFFDQVDPRTGAMTYTYRFELPKARGLSGPELALRYNSSTRDREAGYGWGLDVPSIDLQPISGLPRFDASGTPLVSADAAGGVPLGRERYTFEGQSLVKICDVGAGCPSEPATQGHPDWATGWAYYRPAVEGLFARFYRSANRATWRVQFKGGEVVDFGTPVGESYGVPLGVEVKGTGIVRWNPVVRRDLQHPDNVIVYRWSAPGLTGQSFLTDIYDTPSLTAPTSLLAFAHHVQLDWEAQPFMSGSHQGPDRAAPDARVSRISVTSMPWSGNGPREIYRIYRLTYLNPRGAGVFDAATQAPLWHHSFLKQISQEGHCPGQTESGTGSVPTSTQCSALPPLQFDYEPGANIGYFTSISNIQAGPPGAASSYSVLPFPGSAAIVDFNQDGLPDVVQSWESTCTSLGKKVAVRDSGVSGQPELYCLALLDSDGNQVPPYDYSLRSARPLLGYLNGGGNSFRYQCMDAGTATDYQSIMEHNAGPYTDQQNHLAKFFTPNSNTVLGSFGKGLGVWGRNGYATFFARSLAQSSYEPGQEPPNFALGGCNLDGSFDSAAFFPRWKWETGGASGWNYEAPSRVGTVNDVPEWFVDVDGDGLADVMHPIENVPSPIELRRASVSFTKKYGVGEPAPNSVTGPALMPFVEDANAPQNSLVPIAGQNGNLSGTWDPAWNGRKTQVFYADVNGDGLPDLVTSNFEDSNGTLRVRSGDGSGRFSCDTNDPWVCVPEQGAPDISYYEAAFTSTEKPWQTMYRGAPSLRFFALHDVTGDGLADVIRYDAQTDGTAIGAVEVWVNQDGHTFACVGPGGTCTIGNVFDSVNSTFVSGGRMTFADMNADGVDDIVILAGQGIFAASFFASSPTTDARGTRPGHLIRVRSGSGATTQIQYKTIQDLDVEATSQSKPWAHHSPIVEAVVTQVYTQDASAAAGGAALTPVFLQPKSALHLPGPRVRQLAAYFGWVSQGRRASWRRGRDHGDDVVVRALRGRESAFSGRGWQRYPHVLWHGERRRIWRDAHVSLVGRQASTRRSVCPCGRRAGGPRAVPMESVFPVHATCNALQPAERSARHVQLCADGRDSSLSTATGGFS